MATAFQKVYTKISQITKATCSLKAKGVGYNELATINGKLAQVVKIIGDDVTLQVFEGTGGIPTNAEVVFLGKSRRHKRCGFNSWVGQISLEKEMTTHSTVFAWKIQWAAEPGGLQSMGSKRVGHD